MSSWKKSAGISAVQMTYVVLLVIVVPVLIYIYNNYSYSGEYLQAQSFDYPNVGVPPEHCSDKTGAVADHVTLQSAQNIRFNVTTPANYRADFPHPLLVVWGPSGFNEKLSERFTGLTKAATAQGFIVAHVGSVPLGLKALVELSTIPAQVMETWCVAANQLYYTGHSDGGTVSNALAVLPERGVSPAVIAPSAMGMQGDDMNAYECPAPLSVILMHNKGDNHFPGYGTQVAGWWASCNQCGEASPAPEHPDCIEYTACAAGVRTLFCQADGNHADWPGFHHNIMGFFQEHGVAEKGSGEAGLTGLD